MLQRLHNFEDIQRSPLARFALGSLCQYANSNNNHLIDKVLGQYPGAQNCTPFFMNASLGGTGYFAHTRDFGIYVFPETPYYTSLQKSRQIFSSTPGSGWPGKADPNLVTLARQFYNDIVKVDLGNFAKTRWIFVGHGYYGAILPAVAYLAKQEHPSYQFNVLTMGSPRWVDSEGAEKMGVTTLALHHMADAIFYFQYARTLAMRAQRDSTFWGTVGGNLSIISNYYVPIGVPWNVETDRWSTINQEARILPAVRGVIVLEGSRVVSTMEPEYSHSLDYYVGRLNSYVGNFEDNEETQAAYQLFQRQPNSRNSNHSGYSVYGGTY